MKLIMENWRKYVNESETRQLLFEKQYEDWTVTDLLELMRLARDEENVQANSLLKKMAGIEGAKMLVSAAVPGVVVSAGSLLKSWYDKLSRTPAPKDKVEDFPVLAILNTNPHLIDSIEDNILDAIDEKYEEYLEGLKFDTKIREIISIDDFIHQEIAKDTQKHVVIRDES